MRNEWLCFTLRRGCFVFGTAVLLAAGGLSTPAVAGPRNDFSRAALDVANAMLPPQECQFARVGGIAEVSESYAFYGEPSLEHFGNALNQDVSEFAPSSVNDVRLQTHRPFPPAVRRLFENRKSGDEAQPWDRALANDPTYVIVTPDDDITAVIESLGEAHGPQDLRVILLDPGYYELHIRCLRDWTWLVGRGRDTTLITFPVDTDVSLTNSSYPTETVAWLGEHSGIADLSILNFGGASRFSHTIALDMFGYRKLDSEGELWDDVRYRTDVRLKNVRLAAYGGDTIFARGQYRGAGKPVPRSSRLLVEDCVIEGSYDCFSFECDVECYRTTFIYRNRDLPGSRFFWGLGNEMRDRIVTFKAVDCAFFLEVMPSTGILITGSNLPDNSQRGVHYEFENTRAFWLYTVLPFEISGNPFHRESVDDNNLGIVTARKSFLKSGMLRNGTWTPRR